MTRPERASEQEIDGFLRAASAWMLADGCLVRTSTASTFARGIEWVRDVAVIADRMDHHPDIDIRWRTVTFRLSTHDVGGVTELDFALAEEIDAVIGREVAPPTGA